MSVSSPVDKVIVDNMVLLDSQNIIRFKTVRNPLSDVVNKIDLRYRKNWSGEGYNSVESGSDLEPVSLFGVKQKPDNFEFNWICSSTLAIDLIVFYFQELGFSRDVYEFELLLDNMEIERGDVLSINPLTHLLDSVKVLVLGSGRSMGSGVSQRMDTVSIKAQQMRGWVGNNGFGLDRFGGVEIN